MRKGFSLVELAVVLVILGLLAGGILMGQSLLRNAEIKGVLSALEKFDTSVNMFEQKYGGMPGDIPNATDIWGAVNAVAATCEATASNGTLTCNGNDNGQLGDGPGGVLNSERFHAHIQLKNAGYITGTFTGIAGAGGPNHRVAGVNATALPIARAGIDMGSITVTGGANTHYFDGVHNPLFIAGGQTTDASFWAPIFTPEEHWSMDSKIDDGKPAFGRMRAAKATSPINPNCVTTDTASTAEYNLSNKANLCVAIYIGKSEVRRQ